jgi:hypothetical protein
VFITEQTRRYCYFLTLINIFDTIRFGIYFQNWLLVFYRT